MNRPLLRLVRSYLPMRLQSGFAAIAALVLVVVLAGLGAYMVTFSNAEQLNATKDLRGTRAYWAARAGLEWGLGSVSANNLSACPANATLVIETFNVTVTCVLSTYQDNGARNIFQITAVAAAGGTPGNLDYVERSVRATFE